jgi:hypothetical protein
MDADFEGHDLQAAFVVWVIVSSIERAKAMAHKCSPDGLRRQRPFFEKGFRLDKHLVS